MSKLSEFFSGALVPTERRPGPPAPVPAAVWRGQFRAALAEARAALLHWEACARRVADLRAVARSRADLRAAEAEEVALSDPAPRPSREPEPTVRVRVIEGFSTEWAGLPYAAPAGSIVNLPAGLVRAARQLFEIVDAQTPLHLVQPAPR